MSFTLSLSAIVYAAQSEEVADEFVHYIHNLQSSRVSTKWNFILYQIFAEFLKLLLD